MNIEDFLKLVGRDLCFARIELKENGSLIDSCEEGTLWRYGGIELVELSNGEILTRDEDNKMGRELAIFPYEDGMKDDYERDIADLANQYGYELSWDYRARTNESKYFTLTSSKETLKFRNSGHFKNFRSNSHIEVESIEELEFFLKSSKEERKNFIKLKNNEKQEYQEEVRQWRFDN